MNSYRVSFYKNICNSDGHSFKCLQRQIEVQSVGPSQALQLAERDYHRAMTDAAFGPGADSGAASFIEAVDAARQTLDEVRARRPLV